MRSTFLLRILALAAAALLLQSGPARAWNPNARFCFPQVINVPGPNWQQPPTMDGVISGDNGWTGAWRYVFNNGTYSHDAAVQGVKDANFLYLSVEVNNDSEFSADDAIVVAIDPNGAAANRRLLQIFPVIPAGAASPVPVLYWQGFPWAGGGAAPPAGTQAAVTVGGSPGNRSWFVELKLPRAGFGIPAAGDFGMYFNTVPTKGDLAVEHPWPPTSPTLALDLKNTPDVSGWGQGTVAAATPCSGVYLTAADIRTDNNSPTKINLNAPNTFRATVHNTTVDGSGTYLPANGVNATFRIANFGLSSNWQAISATAPTTNPTAAVNLAANSATDLTTGWTLTAAEQTQYASKTHQCILVELDSNVGTCVGGANPGASCTPAGCTGGGTCMPTVFSQKSAWTNMNFGYASTFESQPTIDPRGWAPPPRGKRTQRLEMLVTEKIRALPRSAVLRQLRAVDATVSDRDIAAASREPEEKDKETSQALAQFDYLAIPADGNYKRFVEQLRQPSVRVTQLTRFVHGCRRSGAFLNIHGNNYEVCDRVGSYGYVLRHADAGWHVWKATGTGFKRDDKTVKRYSVSVSPKNPKVVTERISAAAGTRRATMDRMAD